MWMAVTYALSKMIPIIPVLMFVISFLYVDAEVTSPDGYVSYRQGDFPLIISAPHGGYQRPSSIPSRHDGCLVNGECVYSHGCGTYNSQCRAVTTRDSYTKEIADALWSEIRHLTGKTPHLVINELHRSKMDANRDLDLATFGQPEAVQAYGNYTLFIQQARTLIGLYNDGRGLFVDIHGQTHSEEWVELGYTLSKSELNSGDLDLEDSSIRELAEQWCASNDANCRNSLIYGSKSLGSFLQAEEYKVVPSPAYPSPGSGSYFSGGHNTKVYGSRDCGTIDAIQVEIPKSIRFGDWESFSGDLAKAVINFMQENNYF